MITVIGIFSGASVVAFLVYASFYIGSGVYVKTVSRLPTDKKILALTFDDGPHHEITPLILDVLKKYHVEAVFFCPGENIEKNTLLTRRIMNEGHLIGNHTNRHSALFPFYSSKRMKTEIDDSWNRIVSAGLPDSSRLFRPPFGITNPTLRKALRNSGYTVIGWNIRSLDTIIKDPVVVVRRVTRRIRPGSIILFHDFNYYAAEIIERVIIYALKRGYVFVRLDKYLGIRN